MKDAGYELDDEPRGEWGDTVTGTRAEHENARMLASKKYERLMIEHKPDLLPKAADEAYNLLTKPNATFAERRAGLKATLAIAEHNLRAQLAADHAEAAAGKRVPSGRTADELLDALQEAEDRRERETTLLRLPGGTEPPATPEAADGRV